MEILLQKIYAGIIIVTLSTASWLGIIPEKAIDNEPVIGAYNITGGKPYRLKASVGASDSVINLSEFKEPTSNIPYTMSYLNTAISYGTLSPQTNDKSEFVSFTGITQNSDGSAQLTGVTRGLTRTPQGSGCTASTTLAVRHPAQSIFILSDSPCHQAEYAVKRNDETITGSWTVPTPTAAGNPTPKSYVDALVNGGTVSTDSLIVAGVAGETISRGQIVYFNKYTAQWSKADSDFSSTSAKALLGIAQGAGTVGVNITNGVMVRGLDSTNTGGTPGSILYVSSTAGATSTGAGDFEKSIGIVKSSSQFYFDPSFVNSSIDDSLISPSLGGDGSDGNVSYINGTTVLSRDMYYENLSVTGTAVINPNGYRIYVRDTLTCDATSGAYIGQPGGDATDASGLTAGLGGVSAYASNSGPLPSGQNGRTGLAGQSVTSSQGGSASGVTGTSTIYSIGSGGGFAGGPGNSGAVTVGGSAGSSTITVFPRNYTAANNFFFLYATSSLSVATGTPIFYRGSAGASTAIGSFARADSGITTNSGGAGGSGASGGSLWIEAIHINLTGTCLTVEGGDGGDGGNSSQTGGSFPTSYGEGGGGGGGGAGGVLVLIYRSKTGTGTWSYAGGLGGAGGTSSGGVSNGTAGGPGGGIGGYIIHLGN